MKGAMRWLNAEAAGADHVERKPPFKIYTITNQSGLLQQKSAVPPASPLQLLTKYH